MESNSVRQPSLATLADGKWIFWVPAHNQDDQGETMLRWAVLFRCAELGMRDVRRFGREG